ncbi:hypothetical protein EV384_4524 [Micromonospora kangleipakensis]|uniref:Uncharacterized protein n=2 Tax=Micromonospora kangleipakensis TaxID=1077942 RepID=A0A4Q8BDH1_9ACTN|nr:hypothetical protein EV384_4524 [Micromonospora kangleipakensis]
MPWQAQVARAITFLQAVPVGFAALFDVIVLIGPMARPMYWSDLWFIVGGLSLSGLAVMSAARLAPGRRGAWCGSVAVNAAMVFAWVAAIVWVYVDTRGLKGTDPGMVFASILFVSLPMVAISVTAIGLLSVRSVLRCCFTWGPAL